MPAFPYQLVHRPTALELMDVCTALLEQRLQERLEQQRPRPLGLATGRTMEPLYAALVKRLRAWVTLTNHTFDTWLQRLLLTTRCPRSSEPARTELA